MSSKLDNILLKCNNITVFIVNFQLLKFVTFEHHCRQILCIRPSLLSQFASS